MTEMEKLKKRLYQGGSSAANVDFFPGSSQDSSPEDMARQLNKFFASAENETIDLDKELDN